VSVFAIRVIRKYYDPSSPFVEHGSVG